ncbi:hypothetical protein WR25_01040 [Diploscapter pachys]|uniref:GB1/RHD3-type G domain-containing protein n=1 Tax=Diploscapter pachys TaxID=2018661 RepID=A0A2A2JT26_9BILA|nr:hypothetical protein WR25_01040 [Diploscapter pachys]
MADGFQERNAEGFVDISPSAVPHAIRIVDVVEDGEHSFELNIQALEQVLLDPSVADKKVSVIGVAGAYRKGKSFLLNFFLRYLTWKSEHDSSTHQSSDGDWMAPNEPLRGFSWRGGSERETNGILIWSKPFIVKNRAGEQVAVILMDTQGSFDSQSTVKDCATIFALSTMISSVQIYNLSQNIQEDDLQHLHLFTDYGRLAMESSDSDAKPFQSLQFLVRDWSFPYEAEFGLEGGQTILDKRLQISDKQHPELQQLRKYIHSCFGDISCFLMPHPGLKVATNPHFDGRMHDIEPSFQEMLRVLVPRLMDSSNLVMKEINGQKITCRELVEYFKAYIKIFQGQDLPEPKSMLLATAEANNFAAVAKAKAVYQRMMEEVCGGETPYMSTAELNDEHEKCKNEAVREFRNTRKLGGVEFSIQFLDKLESDLADSYEHFLKVNNGKNLFKSMRTPAVLVSLMIGDYIFQEFFQMLGLNGIAGIFSSILVIVIGALSIWAYSRYSGSLREVASWIDDAVTYVWTNFISPNAGNMGALGGAIQLQDRIENATSGSSQKRAGGNTSASSSNPSYSTGRKVKNY